MIISKSIRNYLLLPSSFYLSVCLLVGLSAQLHKNYRTDWTFSVDPDKGRDLSLISRQKRSCHSCAGNMGAGCVALLRLYAVNKVHYEKISLLPAERKDC